MEPSREPLSAQLKRLTEALASRLRTISNMTVLGVVIGVLGLMVGWLTLKDQRQPFDEARSFTFTIDGDEIAISKTRTEEPVPLELFACVGSTEFLYLMSGEFPAAGHDHTLRLGAGAREHLSRNSGLPITLIAHVGSGRGATTYYAVKDPESGLSLASGTLSGHAETCDAIENA